MLCCHKTLGESVLYLFLINVIYCYLLQEWDAFSGILVADIKGDHRCPAWVDQERALAVSALKVGHTSCLISHI